MNDNILMVSPDNTPMVRICKKKANWYLSRKLAIMTNEDTLQLLFTPKGEGKSEYPYYLQKIDNICVICGNSENITKHHVVPYRYRKHFPKNIKESSSYDVLILCRDCHDKYEKESEKLKNVIFEKYTGKNLKQEHQNFIKKKKIYTKYKLLNDSTLNEKARVKILESLKDCEKINILDFEDDSFKEGLEVAKNVKDFIEFFIFWRKHFVNTMSPAFLPKYWRINEKII